MTDWSALIRDHGTLVWRTAYRLLSHDANVAYRKKVAGKLVPTGDKSLIVFEIFSSM